MQMKIMLLVLGAVVVVGGGAIFLTQKNTVKGSTPDAPIAASSSVQSDTSAKTAEGTSLKDLLGSLTSKKCTVTTTNDQVDSSGIVYVADGKMRSDFTSVQKTGALAGKQMLAHMIVDTDMSYMWGEGEMKIGIKMARKDMLDVAPSEGNTPANQAAMDMNEKSEYHCDGWTVDTSMFIPPANISFNDMSQMMKAPPVSATAGAKVTSPASMPTTMTPEQMKSMCGSCDQAGANKAQCLEALGCK